MYTKEWYRTYFQKWKKYVRYAPVLEDAGVPRANFSQFLNGSNTNALSVEKLEMIRKRMTEVFSDICKEGTTDGKDI